VTKATEPRFFNRELSWMEFNQRVLDEALDQSIPLIERLKFLAITASNLDEFFMVRVGSLQALSRQSGVRLDPAGMTPEEQLTAVCSRARQMVEQQYRCYQEELEPRLTMLGIRRLRPADLSEKQLKIAEQVFDQEIFPVLTPIALTCPEDFPLVVNHTISLFVELSPDSKPDAPVDGATLRFAMIPFGRTRNRFITLPSELGYSYLLLEDLVGIFVERLFIGQQVLDCVPFRMSRNADMAIREDQASDLLTEMQEILDARRQSECVRLEISSAVSPTALAFLSQATKVSERETFAVSGPIDLSAFMRLCDLQGYDAHRYEAWPPRSSPQIDPTESMFATIAKRDVLLCHPYESFEPVVRLLEDAADDPDVIAIKQTLYRTSRNSPIVAALKRAALSGKHVTAVVELKARFDEARNIHWARDLEQAEVQVIYGVKGLKTHAKVCLIARREPQGVVRYVHFGTGNYNEITSRLYGDISYMSCNEDLGADASAFFNAVTGYSQPQAFRKIDAAPIGMREKLLEMIDSEVQFKRGGQRGLIYGKLNSLVDEQLIEALYAASAAGVKVRLSIRGICCLRPGVPGLSENITVTSVVDRFLEHSRIFFFYHGGDERLFISSADWMPRNLDRRLELLVPVEDSLARDRLLAILKIHLQDNIKARKLLPSGRYERLKPVGQQEPIHSQALLYQRVNEAVQNAAEMRPTMFEPYRAVNIDH
jgi:polyphosphate kinase